MTWHAKKLYAYGRSTQEAIDNAKEIYATLYDKGWTLNAVCGVLGNMGAESGYNPWRWQNDAVGRSTGSPWTKKGYGLVQFTPASKYINNAKNIEGYSPNFSDMDGTPYDGYAQLLYINDYADYKSTHSYPLDYNDFKNSKLSPEYLASAWLYNYERPKAPQDTEYSRRANAMYWWRLLYEKDPDDPDEPFPPDPPAPIPPIKPSKRKMPMWMYTGKIL